MKKDRRKRFSRPFPILVFGIYFLLLPIANYFSFAYAHNIHWTYPSLILSWLHPVEFLILILAIPAGIGLLLVKKWGWYYLLVYAIVFILFDIIAFILKPIAFNLFALGNSIIGFSAIIYFTRESISAPYLKLYPRGWRFETRTPIQIQLRLNGKDCTTKDFSKTGFYVSWPDFPGEPGQEVQVVILETSINAGIVRIDQNGLGVAFRNLQPNQIQLLEDILSSKTLKFEKQIS